MSEQEWEEPEPPEEAPDECEWDEDCERQPFEELYAFSETDEELWVCQGHFIESMHGHKPPSEMNIWDVAKCQKCGKRFEKVEDHGIKEDEVTGIYEPACDCDFEKNIQLSVG